MAKDNLQVIEPNQIIEAKLKKMSKGFLDTLYVGMTLVAETFENDDPERLEYSFYARELAEKYGLENEKSIYKKLKDQVTSTMEKDSLMYINENGEDIRYFVFQEVRYADGEGKVTIVFSNRFKKALHQMLLARGKKAYFGLRDVMGMKSEYTKKMYPILLEYMGKPMEFAGTGSLKGKKFDRIDTLENFKELLCIPKSYVIKNIKDVCDTIQAEIEAYTPYHAEAFYNQLAGRGRYGGKITHICWTIEKKEKAKSRPLTESEKAEYDRMTAGAEQMTLEEVAPQIEPTVKWLMDLTGLDVKSASIVNNAAMKNGRDFDYIKEAYEVAKSNGAEDLGKLMTHFMKAGFSKKSKALQKKNSFNSFQQRDYDFDALEKELLKR